MAVFFAQEYAGLFQSAFPNRFNGAEDALKIGGAVVRGMPFPFSPEEAVCLPILNQDFHSQQVLPTKMEVTTRDVGSSIPRIAQAETISI